VHYLSTCGSGIIARMCVADVAGHGESVAQVSAVMHEHLKRTINRVDQRRVLRGLNHRLARMGVDTMTTLAALTYLPPTGTVRISYAGHEPGWLYRKRENRWKRLHLREEEGLVNVAMAVERQTRYSQRKLRVNEGDRVLLVTDGVLETTSPDEKFFGPAGVDRVLAEHPAADCRTLVDALLTALKRHADADELTHDDVTLLLVEFASNTQGPTVWRMLKNRILRPKGNSHLPAFANPGGRTPLPGNVQP
jgi:sigma-B regulation protein RsbU (phosphoserine phosphatase)